MIIWPTRAWSRYPGPNRCEAGCQRPASRLLTWAGQHDRAERYCATCADLEDTKLIELGAGVALSTTTNEDPAGAINTGGVNPCTEATVP